MNPVANNLMMSDESVLILSSSLRALFLALSDGSVVTTSGMLHEVHKTKKGQKNEGREARCEGRGTEKSRHPLVICWSACSARNARESGDGCAD